MDGDEGMEELMQGIVLICRGGRGNEFDDRMEHT
jgi:hypothetical protein